MYTSPAVRHRRSGWLTVPCAHGAAEQTFATKCRVPSSEDIRSHTILIYSLGAAKNTSYRIFGGGMYYNNNIPLGLIAFHRNHFLSFSFWCLSFAVDLCGAAFLLTLALFLFLFWKQSVAKYVPHFSSLFHRFDFHSFFFCALRSHTNVDGDDDDGGGVCVCVCINCNTVQVRLTATATAVGFDCQNVCIRIREGTMRLRITYFISFCILFV